MAFSLNDLNYEKDNYDGDTVTFHYNRHEDNKYIEETPSGDGGNGILSYQ